MTVVKILSSLTSSNKKPTNFSLLHQFILLIPSKSHKLFSSSSTTPPIPNSLLHKLLQVHNSHIKTLLNSYLGGNKNSLDFSWDDFITAVKASSSEKARLVLEWRLEKMLKDNENGSDHYSELISLCGRIQNLPLAMQVFTSMEASGIMPTSSVFNALIHACLSSNNVMTAITLFEIMQCSERYKPDNDTYNTFITGFSNLGNYETMRAWHSAKKAAGYSADLKTYDSLILGSIKAKKFDSVDELFKEMVQLGIKPSTSLLNNVLNALCLQKNFAKLEEFLKFMLNGGWELDVRVAEKLVLFYIELGRVVEMEELLLTLMESEQAPPEVLSQIHYGIIRTYVMLDKLDDVEYAVGRMLKHGISFTYPEDVEKIICLYFKQAAYDRLDLFLERIKGLYKLRRSTHELLMAGYRRAGLLKNLNLVMNDEKSADFS